MINKIIISFLLLFCIELSAQTKSNLDNINELIEKSVAKVDSVAGLNDEFYLEVTSSPQLEILKNKLWERFSANGRKVNSEIKPNLMRISYSLLDASVVYSEPRRDGFFGDMLCDRQINITGSVIIKKPDGSVKNYSVREQNKDVINLADIKNLETASLPFAQSQIPEPSFFSNLLEPVLVVGTLIGTVILLFTVRGK